MQCCDLFCAFGIEVFLLVLFGVWGFLSDKSNIVKYDRDWTSAVIFKYSSEFILKVAIYGLELDF